MKLISVKKISILIFLLLIVFSLASCKEKPAESSIEEQPELSLSSADEEVETIIDREGKEIILPAQIEKIICVSPEVTETLIHLGFADKLVAVDEYSIDVEGVPEGLPVFDIMAPDTESIIALEPDIIFATAMSKVGGEDLFKPVTDLGVLVTCIPAATNIEAIKQNIQFIGEITETADKAGVIIKEMEVEIEEILAKLQPATKTQSVYFEVSAAPDMYSFGTGTFLSEIIELLGAENILADQQDWLAVSEEIVLAKNPDIIFTNIDYIEDPVNEILTRNGWDVVTAVKDQKVFFVDKDGSSRANEYITIVMREMAQALYPELFS